MAKRQSKADKALDKEISAIFYRTSSGVQIRVLDIHQIFAAGKAAAAAGDSIEAAVVAAVTRLRMN